MFIKWYLFLYVWCKCLSNGICFYMYGVNVFTAFKNQKLEKVIETIKIQDPNNSVFYREN